MGYTSLDGTRYRKGRSEADRAADRRLADIELGIVDPVLHWRQINTLVFGDERNFDAFQRLTEGVRSGGKLITLGTVARPGGRRALKSQVLLFLHQFEEADARARELAVGSGQSGEQRTLRLVGVGGGGGGPHAGSGVGMHLDVSA